MALALSSPMRSHTGSRMNTYTSLYAATATLGLLYYYNETNALEKRYRALNKAYLQKDAELTTAYYQLNRFMMLPAQEEVLASPPPPPPPPSRRAATAFFLGFAGGAAAAITRAQMR